MAESASTHVLHAFSQGLADIVNAASSSVVAVHARRAQSSGFIWQPGLVVTADEALAEEEEIAITLPGGEVVDARLAGRDPGTDVALLRIDRPYDAVIPRRAPDVAAGALAVTVGSEDGSPTAALGIVSRAGGAWRSVRGGEIDTRIELSLTMRRSAEGGLVLDTAGRRIGMAVFGPRRRVLVIPAATLDRVAARLDSHGRVARGYLGLGLQPVTVEGTDASGVMVMGVDPKGPGAAAGVHQGDVIVAWNGGAVRHVQALIRSLGPDSIGQTVQLGLRRAGNPVEVQLVIGERAPG